jgi:hypothetical protein
LTPPLFTLNQNLLACTRYGLPLTLYGDHLGVFVRNDPDWTLAEKFC